MKRYQLIEAGIKISRVRLQAGGKYSRGALQMIQQLDTFSAAAPVVAEHVWPDALTVLKAEYMSEADFGADVAKSTALVDILIGLDDSEQCWRTIRLGLVELLREAKMECSLVAEKIRLGCALVAKQGHDFKG